jgi:2-amino-4-hydroxy-6-hydroxymethyldihydropteridine diphosphokinase
VSNLIHKVYLSTGSNQGNSIEILKAAIHKINLQAGRVHKVSSFYRTAAWGLTNQPDFFNQCLLIYTPFPPKLLLQKLLWIEKQMGRVRMEKWGPRTIDIDILLFDDLILKDIDLEIPHPHIQDRSFVLAPLAEIAPNLKHPSLKKSIHLLLKTTPDSLSFKRIQA